jgi:hypothetical protein
MVTKYLRLPEQNHIDPESPLAWSAHEKLIEAIIKALVFGGGLYILAMLTTAAVIRWLQIAQAVGTLD